MNFAEDEVLVQVTNYDDSSQEPYVIIDQKPYLRRLIINSEHRLHLALVGQKVFWSSYRSTEIFYYDLKAKTLHKLPLDEFAVKTI